MIYTAQWVLPSASESIENGALAVSGDTIVAVGPRETVQEQFPGATVHDYGAAVLLPGLVNCHTHLELTVMRGFLDTVEHDFLAWLMQLTAARNERLTPEDLYISAVWGLVEAARAGVTCVGDASSKGWTTLQALRETGLRGVVFQESFGPDPSQAEKNFTQLRETMASLRELETPLARAGVSPHAPYTVSAKQLELISDYALAENLPVMMHAAESLAEDDFMRRGHGPFATRLRQRGLRWRAHGVSTIQYLQQLGVLRTRPLLAHCVRVDEKDMDTIADADAAIAHCPKSNAKLNHGRAPYAEFCRKGLRVGLGSDSVASNNLCDMLEEARFAFLLARANGRQIAVTQALASATQGGAESLHIENQIGALTPGKQADFIAVALDGPHQTPVYDPTTALITSSTGRDVRLTVVAGREIYRDGRVLTVDETRLAARMREIAAKLA